ncbi:MAG: hypothetical protein IJH55_07625 [Romboutsia sp.]|nr:hypothetical protein [Romboutsia sp.]
MNNILGGISSPNPLYKQEVEYVRGKNIDSSTVESGSLSNGENIAHGECYRSTDYITVKPNTQYIFSVNNTANRVVVSMYNSNKQFIDTDGTNGYVSENGKFTTYSNCEYIRFRSYGADGQLFNTGNIQIEKGSVATPFLPYNTLGVKIRGNQLFQTPNTQTLTDVTLTKNSDGSFDLSGTAGANRDFSTGLLPIASTGLKLGGSYYLSVGQTFSGVSIQIVGYNSNNGWVATTSMQSTTQGQAITLFSDSSITQIAFILRVYSGTTINQQNIKIMLNEGSTASPYEQYITPINKQLFLRDKELYEDSYISYENGDFYFNDNYKKTYPTAGNFDTATSPYNNMIVFAKPTDDIKYNTYQTNTNNKCNKAPFLQTSYSAVQSYRVAGNAYGDRYVLVVPKTTTSEDVANIFNGLYIIYQVTTPIKTKVTNTTQISQLEDIWNAQSLNGTTIIEIEGDLPMIMKIRALKGK